MGDARGAVQALTAAQAAIVTLSAAIGAGDATSVAEESERALAAGLSAAAVYEAILQSYLFVGFPRAIEGFFAAGPVLGRSGGKPAEPAPVEPPAWMHAGESLCRRVYGRNHEKLMETMRALSPDLTVWMVLEGYGKTLSRPALGPVEREYAVIAILTVTRMWRQLRSHAIGAVNVGGTRAGVREAIALCRPWSSEATIRDALRVSRIEANHARG